jgi:hypothetical protein
MRLPFCVIDKKLTFATPRVLIRCHSSFSPDSPSPSPCLKADLEWPPHWTPQPHSASSQAMGRTGARFRRRREARERIDSEQRHRQQQNHANGAAAAGHQPHQRREPQPAELASLLSAIDRGQVSQDPVPPHPRCNHDLQRVALRVLLSPRLADVHVL